LEKLVGRAQVGIQMNCATWFLDASLFQMFTSPADVERLVGALRSELSAHQGRLNTLGELGDAAERSSKRVTLLLFFRFKPSDEKICTLV
jgi:hypothetical protein